MSTTDERLSDLLAQRARQGSGVHPTFEGVETVITRRAARRRHRVVGGAMGAVIVIALVAGAVALSRADGDGTVDSVADLPDAPLVGVDEPGLDLVETDVRPLGAGTDPPLTYTSFGSSTGPAGPVVTVVVDPAGDVPPPGGRAVDLDGDGDATGEGDGFVTTVGTQGAAVGLLWPLPDGRVAGFGGYEVSEEFLVHYVRGLDGEAFDVATLPNPDGLDERRTSTVPSPVATQAMSAYAGADGTLQVLTTNDPGWFDLMRMSIDANVGTLTETPIGESFLGPGVAEITPAGEGSAYAVVRTDAGLTIEISTEGIGVDVVNQILAEGRLVEVSPVDEPTPTTSVAAVTTAVPTTTVVTPTSVADEMRPLPAVQRSLGAWGDHIVLEFDDFQPAVGAVTVLEELTGGCARYGTDFEEVRQDDEEVALWAGWLTIELDTRFVGIEGPVFGGDGDGYVLCTNASGPATIAVPVFTLGEPTVTPLSGRPHIVVDVTRCEEIGCR